MKIVHARKQNEIEQLECEKNGVHNEKTHKQLAKFTQLLTAQ